MYLNTVQSHCYLLQLNNNLSDDIYKSLLTLNEQINLNWTYTCKEVIMHAY